MSAPVARFALPSLATIYRTALPTHNSGVDGWSGSRSTSLRIDISALDPVSYISRPEDVHIPSVIFHHTFNSSTTSFGYYYLMILY